MRRFVVIAGIVALWVVAGCGGGDGGSDVLSDQGTDVLGDPGTPTDPGPPNDPGHPVDPGIPNDPGGKDPGKPDDPGAPNDPGQPDDPGTPSDPGGKDPGPTDPGKDEGSPPQPTVTCDNLPIAGPQGPVATDDCKTCVDVACCNEAKACAANPDCMNLRLCYALECMVDECGEQCHPQHPNGMADSEVFDVCLDDNCPEVCAKPANIDCAGSVVWPQPATATYEYTYGIEEAITELRVEGATVKICAFSDPECTTPETQGTTDADGKVTLTIPAGPQGLDGYVEISSPTIITTLGFYSYPDNEVIYKDKLQEHFYMVMSPTVFGMLMDLSGVTMDTDRGHLIFSSDDCELDTAMGFSAGVSTADQDTIAVYMLGGAPTQSITATSSEGTGGVINVPPGNATVTTTHEPTGTKIGELPVIFRKGAITSVILGPTPL